MVIVMYSCSCIPYVIIMSERDSAKDSNRHLWLTGMFQGDSSMLRFMILADEERISSSNFSSAGLRETSRIFFFSSRVVLVTVSAVIVLQFSSIPLISN